MDNISLYQVLKKIPGVTDEEARQAAAAAGQTDQLDRIETGLAKLQAEFRITSYINLVLLVVILAIKLAPLVH